jgi:hypothetical protein
VRECGVFAPKVIFQLPVTSVQSLVYLPTRADFTDWAGLGRVSSAGCVRGSFLQQFDPQSARLPARQFDPWFDRLSAGLLGRQFHQLPVR